MDPEGFMKLLTRLELVTARLESYADQGHGTIPE